MATDYITAFEHQPVAITPEATATSLSYSEAERLERLNDGDRTFFRRELGRIKLAQYCGLVNLGTRILEILPKVQDDASPEQCQGVLLRLLRHSHRFPQFRHQNASQHMRRAHLLEVFIAAYFDAVTAVCRGGLLRQYRQHAEDLNVVRGRIQTSRQFAVNANRPDIVACQFDDLTIDNVWNRILSKALNVVRSRIRSLDLQRRWIELAALFEGVDDSRLAPAEITHPVYNRQAERYRYAVDWARLLIALLAPSLRAGTQDAPALLFNMNHLFEATVANALHRRLPNEVHLSTQDVGMHLATAHADGRSFAAYALRPDLVFRKQNRVIALADTKWKLIKRDGRHLKPSEPDMYQMAAYASAYQCDKVTLIYPWSSELEGSAATHFELARKGVDPIVVRVVCLDVGSDALTCLPQTPGSPFD